MAITITHLMNARRMVFTGRDTFTTASSWAWAHGPDGVMATAGADIALKTAAAAAIAVAAVMLPTTAILPAAEEAAEQFVAAQVALTTATAQFVPAEHV